MILDLAMLHPRREPAEFPVVAVVRHPHLRTDEKNLTIVDDYTAVVDHIFVHYRPTNGIFSDNPIWHGHRETNIPMSQTIPYASGDLRISARTSHE